MKRKGRIYLITNLSNGKLYIGKTLETLRERWIRHVYEAKKGSNYVLAKAIRKYGEYNFTIVLKI